MKIFKLFVTKIFLKRAIIFVSILGLIFMANYLSFISARSIFSTLEGYQEIKRIDKKGNYIANLDPESSIDLEIITNKKIQDVYDFLSANSKYAFYTDGFIVEIPNNHDMSVSLSYMNEEYYNLNQFELSDGKNLDFEYQLDNSEFIPVLVGKGLSQSYPVGTLIEIEEPVLGKSVTLKVQGILKENLSHSNFYALNSKQYYNFSIFLPVNDEFLFQSNIDLKLNGLMDIIILETSQKQVDELQEVIHDNLKFRLNFFSQKENFEYFNEYFFSSLKFIALITVGLLIVITCISIWNALVGIRLMIKDFTINFLVGLSYSKFRKILYIYYGLLFLISLMLVFLITIYSRYGCWLRKDYFFATYGFLGLIEMDWLSLLTVIFFDVIIGILVTEITIKRIKKVPISVGVLR